MGMFTKNQAAVAETIYNKEVKQFVKPKDGKTHILMVNSFSKWVNQNFGVEDKYTTQLDLILSGLQDDGYEVIDVKFDSLKNQGIAGNMDGFHTLITYK